ncbi:MAG: hypothetical protein JW727_01360 [Candidatus Aenigmarchaeota archaeon]|nr:hypothetical protein [Candidatus Aenigmarchaeota archaeon]
MLSKKEIALARIKTLFCLAEEEAKRGNPERSRRYIGIARKISMKVQEPIPRDLKRKFCKKCDSILIPGLTSSIRLTSQTGMMAIKCFRCNNIKRYPYKKYGRNEPETGGIVEKTEE